MNIHRLLILIGMLLLPLSHFSLAGDNVPHEINGFRLGASIDEYDFISYHSYLREVIIDDIGGFRKGEISYGACRPPRRNSQDKNEVQGFKPQILLMSCSTRYKEKFGKPDEFTGDAFGIVLSWKWHFTDKDNNYITLTLQHNQKNIDENIGNMVKLTMPDRIDAERECFINQCQVDKKTCPASMMSESWENMIPR